MQLKNDLQSELIRRRCRKDYGEYVKFSNTGFYMTKFHRYLTSQIQEFLETPSDKAMSILLLSVPPRHGKTFTLTETLPSWYLGKYPTSNVIIAGYESSFAEMFSRRNRDKFNEYATQIFKDAAPNDKVQGVAQWETSLGVV